MCLIHFYVNNSQKKYVFSWCFKGRYAVQCSKPALLEGLEIDQFIWGIIQSLSSAPYDEVSIDSTANWKPVPPLGLTNDQQDLGAFCKSGVTLKCLLREKSARAR